MANRLASATSPYLRQHADNPVNWYPWGEEAFTRAKEEDKPLFLSIGYSTCHWCHVMAHESFEDPEVAAYLNEHFVSIKVDREERPDVDRVYMSYVQAITGHGGWPLSVWLTPERMPFFGGTYFPPRDRGGMRGFLSLLKAIAEGWKKERQTLVNEATRVLATLAHHTRNAAAPREEEEDLADTLIDVGGQAFEGCFQHLYESYSAEDGGFGGAPKFPRASNLNFLFRAAVIQGIETEPGKEALQMALNTLRHMAKGGIHDAVGGGFHRYSVDAGWFVPHFEKMLYDQAQIALNYLEAQQASGEPIYGEIARSIFSYVKRDLRHPRGAFFSAEDADSATDDGRGHGGKGEGAFYVWGDSEIESLLGADADLFCQHYGILPEGNVPASLDPHQEFGGKNILRQTKGVAETAEEFGLTPSEASERLTRCLEVLRVARERRPRPSRDEKIVAGWNGLMISALARGALVLDEPQLLLDATQAAEFLRTELYDSGRNRLYRSHCGVRGEAEGFAEDYALVIQASLDLYEATTEGRWLIWAVQLQKAMDEEFEDADQGGYFATRAQDPHLVLRLKDDYDGAEPAANSVAAMNLFRLRALFPANPDWARRGYATLQALRSQWGKWPQAMPQLLCAIELALEVPRQVVLAGRRGDTSLWPMQREVFLRLGPRRAVLYVTDPADEVVRDWLPALQDFSLPPSGTTAYVCEHYTCKAPVTTAAELRQMLDSST